MWSPKLFSRIARNTVTAGRGLSTRTRPALGNGTAETSRPPVSPHLGFYHSFGRPLSKVFLIAMGTYQVLYWSWLKLAVMEEQRGRIDEIRILEEKLDVVRRREGERVGTRRV